MAAEAELDVGQYVVRFVVDALDEIVQCVGVDDSREWWVNVEGRDADRFGDLGHDGLDHVDRSVRRRRFVGE